MKAMPGNGSGSAEPDGAPRAHVSDSLLHDMRTPLSQIIGYSELLAEQAEDDGLLAFAKDLNTIRTAGKILLDLVNENFDSSDNQKTVPRRDRNEQTIANRSSDSNAVALPSDVPQSKKSLPQATGSILVVDDEEQNRDLVSKRLSRLGNAVVAVASGSEAFSALRSHPFDLVLLDIMMPDMDGYEVLRLLKNDPELNSIPVVMISALSDVEGIAKCIAAGADDYLSKPFDATLLKARVLASLDKKRAHDREKNLFDQLQENYKRLQILEKQRDDLTNMIVHDLRTPLTSVIGGLRTLSLIGDLNTQQQEIADISISGGDELLGMINDLLDVEKMASGSLDLDLVVISVPEVVASSVAQVSNLAREKHIDIVIDLPEYLPIINADESKLRRVITNLLGNAIKFTPLNGKVIVAAKSGTDNRSVEISVTDTGEGIPSEALESVFEKFVQVRTRIGGRTMSNGLGLAFCKLAIEAHGGSVTVVSAVGNGSTFTFTLPSSD